MELPLYAASSKGEIQDNVPQPTTECCLEDNEKYAGTDVGKPTCGKNIFVKGF